MVSIFHAATPGCAPAGALPCRAAWAPGQAALRFSLSAYGVQPAPVIADLS